MLRKLPETKGRGKRKTQPPGQATAESVASSRAHAVKATLATLGAYAALTAPPQPLGKDIAARPENAGVWVGERPGICGAPVSRGVALHLLCLALATRGAPDRVPTC